MQCWRQSCARTRRAATRRARLRRRGRAPGERHPRGGPGRTARESPYPRRVGARCRVGRACSDRDASSGASSGASSRLTAMPLAAGRDCDGPGRRWDQHLADRLSVGCCCLLGDAGRHSVHQSAKRAQLMTHSASLAWSAAARASRRETPFRTTPRASRLTVQVNHRAISYSAPTSCQPAVHLHKRASLQVSTTPPADCEFPFVSDFFGDVGVSQCDTPRPLPGLSHGPKRAPLAC